jgi:hypothetical protein
VQRGSQRSQIDIIVQQRAHHMLRDLLYDQTSAGCARYLCRYRMQGGMP